MKEKIFKKEIKRGLFGVVLALAMVVTLMPMHSMKVLAAKPWPVCPTCNGSRFSRDGWHMCGTCDGTGKDPSYEVCPTCKGSRVSPDGWHFCGTCDGNVYVKKNAALTGSVLSSGQIGIIIAVPVVALAALVFLVVAKKKKKKEN